MNVKPFLRWAGGKRWLVNRIIDSIPDDINYYYEPFLGSGALFFKVYNKFGNSISYEISDINEELINTFIVVRDKCNELIHELSKFKNTKDEYYMVRSKKESNLVARAARFIYLNRTSFNGIYRVNKQGNYNVPYGYKEYKTLFDYDNLNKCSIALKNVILSVKSFEEIDKIKSSSFFYLDPPYTIAHEKNGFLKYNQNIFLWQDQEKLAQLLKIIDYNNSYFVMSNAYHYSTNNLFHDCGKIIIENRYSVIGGNNAKREKIKEIIVSNIFQ